MSSPEFSSSPTISDIARAVGVGKATVSRALNSRAGVHPKTREKIRRVADEMGYAVNPVLASLGTRRFRGSPEEGQVAVAILSRSQGTLQDLHIYHEEARRRKWLLEHFDTLQWPDPAKLSRVIRNKGFLAVIAHRVTMDPTYFKKLDWHGVAAVRDDPALIDPPLSVVRPSETTALWIALNRMRDLGYRRIGVVIPDWSAWRIENVRHLGIVLAFHRLSPPEETVEPFNYDFTAADHQESNFSRFRDWLSKEQPDSLLAQKFFLPIIQRLPREQRLPCALLGAGEGYAGLRSQHGSHVPPVFDMIDHLIRSCRFGILDNPVETIIPARWHDGPSLPPKQG